MGFIIGLVVSLKTVKAGPKAIAEFERKNVGFGERMRIYLGFPFFVMALLTPLFRQLPQLVGEKYFIYVALGIVLVIIAVSLFLYDRISKRFIVPIGIVGWMLTLSLIIWFFFFGPGVR